MKIKLPTKKKTAATRTASRRKAAPKPKQIKLKASVARRAPRSIPEDEEEYYDEQEPNMKLSHAFVVVLVLHVIAVGGVFAFNNIKTRQSPVFTETTTEKTAPAKETTTDSTTAAVATKPTTEPTTTTARKFEPRSLTQAPGSRPAAPATAAAVPAGPIATAEAVAPDAPADPAPATDQVHVMRPGDTLTRISTLFGVSIDAIQSHNNISDPTKIRVGEKIRIPGAAATQVAANSVPPPAPVAIEPAPAPVEAAPPAPAPASAPAASGTYTIVAGDNPWAIAKKLGVSYQKLIEVNKIEDPTKIQIGQELTIPAE